MATNLPSLSSKSHCRQPRRPTPVEGLTVAAQQVTNRGTPEPPAYCLLANFLAQAGSATGDPRVRALTLLLAMQGKAISV